MAPFHPCQPEFCSNCDRFAAWYRLTGTEQEAWARARELCLEQTVEFPGDLLPAGHIVDEIVARVDRVEPVPGADGAAWLALVTFLNHDTGFELTQLLNTLFGNISLKSGHRLERLVDCPLMWRTFRGPRFGPDGLRRRLGVLHRPLLCTALKPLGLNADQLASLAYQFAIGGIDVVKDDHGLANQPFARFAERAERCAAAVLAGSERLGRPILYAPNITAPAGRLVERAHHAKRVGAGALLVCPGLVGFDAMRTLADDDDLDLPILAHPALLGSHVVHADSGVSHRALFGQWMRLAGADAVIYPHHGGRFGFSLQDCRDIVDGASSPLGDCRPTLPMPGGGMTLARVPELLRFYGQDVALLIGGDLLRGGPDVAATCRNFVAAVGGRAGRKQGDAQDLGP
ncbi:MAG: ribulose 1,5-bisphosphate carboxylase large subunit [Deltaproteobacteria bacterium]|nr:ribulose 1,5-bisphosphate carboxylase large subunit [Deltaproteobacteria bacterium]